MYPPPSKKSKIAEFSENPVLYHIPNYCSSKVVDFINYLGIQEQVQIFEMSRESIKSDEYLELNPLGTVPMLVEGKQKLLESGAIILYLLDKFGPGDDSVASVSKAQLYQWIFFSCSTMYPVIRDAMIYKSNIDFISTRKDGFNKIREFLICELKDKSFLLGDSVSAADICISYELEGAKRLEWISESEYPLQGYLSRVKSSIASKKTPSTKTPSSLSETPIPTMSSTAPTVVSPAK